MESVSVGGKNDYGRCLSSEGNRGRLGTSAKNDCEFAVAERSMFRYAELTVVVEPVCGSYGLVVA